jgi:hypothetical protein
MITKFGKRFLTDFVAGNVSFANKDLAIGIANSIEYPLSTSNSRLGFEFYRLPIKFGGIDIDTSVSPAKYTAIFSATLPPNMSGKINELGIYPSNRTSKNNYDSRFISDFELPYDWSDTPNLDQTNYRVGDSSLTFISNGASSKEYKSTISGFEQGYNIQSINLSEMTTFGSPDKANINTLGITVVPSESQSSVSLDGLRINDEDTFDPSYGLIARSILDSEIEKVFGREMFIEFKLDVAFGD